MTETVATQTPFEQGYRAGLAGTDPRLCPYDRMTKEDSEWQRGFVLGADYATARRDALSENAEDSAS